MKAIVVPPEHTPRTNDVLDSIAARLGECAKSMTAAACGSLMALKDLQAEAPAQLQPLIVHAMRTTIYLATAHHGVTEGDLEGAIRAAEADTADFLKTLNQGESP